MIKSLFIFLLISQSFFMVSHYTKMIPGVFKHIRCRNTKYPKSGVERFKVPDELIFWSESYPEYKPATYESSILVNKSWADLPIGNPKFQPRWNLLDGNVNRASHSGEYKIENGLPMNMFGRTGITARGILGRWGPNHAADPIVTKWKVDDTGALIVHQKTEKRILQMCAIERHDCGEWALPGGMVDPGEMVSLTLKREFMEEAMSTSSSTEELEKFFEAGQEIYKGYVDDPRNTDNAWMETVAVNFHDETGEVVGNFKLHAGDDAAKVKWMDIHSGLKLYASHLDIVRNVVEKLDAHW